MPPQTTRILIVDDDPSAVDYLAHLMRREFPDALVTARLKADVQGDFDIYLIDNDFEGRKVAGQLTEEIRLRHPDALILLFSASFDVATLKALLNAGCDAVADKSEPRDQALLMDLVHRYRAARLPATRTPAQQVSAVSALTTLIREWNTRYNRSRMKYES